jgi:hypothetical protein
METMATGVDPEGNYISRSTLHYFSAVKSDLAIGTVATATVVGDIVEISVKFTGSESDATSYLAYAEVRIFFFEFSSNFSQKLNFHFFDTLFTFFST